MSQSKLKNVVTLSATVLTMAGAAAPAATVFAEPSLAELQAIDGETAMKTVTETEYRYVSADDPTLEIKPSQFHTMESIVYNGDDNHPKTHFASLADLTIEEYSELIPSTIVDKDGNTWALDLTAKKTGTASGSSKIAEDPIDVDGDGNKDDLQVEFTEVETFVYRKVADAPKDAEVDTPVDDKEIVEAYNDLNEATTNPAKTGKQLTMAEVATKVAEALIFADTPEASEISTFLENASKEDAAKLAELIVRDFDKVVSIDDLKADKDSALTKDDIADIQKAYDTVKNYDGSTDVSEELTNSILILHALTLTEKLADFNATDIELLFDATTSEEKTLEIIRKAKAAITGPSDYDFVLNAADKQEEETPVDDTTKEDTETETTEETTDETTETSGETTDTDTDAETDQSDDAAETTDTDAETKETDTETSEETTDETGTDQSEDAAETDTDSGIELVEGEDQTNDLLSGDDSTNDLTDETSTSDESTTDATETDDAADSSETDTAATETGSEEAKDFSNKQPVQPEQPQTVEQSQPAPAPAPQQSQPLPATGDEGSTSLLTSVIGGVVSIATAAWAFVSRKKQN